MTHHAPVTLQAGAADPVDRTAELRHVLSLVERIAGRKASPLADKALDEAARVSSAYGEAHSIVQRRFDALAAETAAWAAAGVEALVSAGEGDPPRAAAGRLADELARALRQMAKVLGL